MVPDAPTVSADGSVAAAATERRIVFMGTPEFAAVALQALIAAELAHHLAVVHRAGRQDHRPGLDPADPLDHRAHVRHAPPVGAISCSKAPSRR